ncbi:replication protein RepA [Gluconobacter cerinus]|uniref:replication protein RepA n=1 Tax=Gluconobacter cerinus TaxID=38307 RepID=UPI001B8CC27F|nr:replication protein RepA [Gluconobacter cerinus]MBS0984279.1 replication protein RepA [Gluconobacter cerinus]
MDDHDDAQKQFDLSPISEKIVRLSTDIRTTPPERPEYLHTVLCQVGLPRRRPAEPFFERKNGKASLLITAGKMYDGEEWIQQIVPYGTKPRLALFHISSEAVRLQSRTIPVGRSIRAFMRRLNLDTNGRSMTAFRQQMNALCACQMQLAYGSRNIDAKPVELYDAWTNNGAPGQESVIELSEKFWHELREAAVPLDGRALEALQHSCLALDTYTWLAHRLRRISKINGEHLTWMNMRQQFGQEYKGPEADKNFKKAFNLALRQVMQVYPQARLESVRTGFRLLPSPAPVAPLTTFIDMGHTAR